jgi:hypothetical protein
VVYNQGLLEQVVKILGRMSLAFLSTSEHLSMEHYVDEVFIALLEQVIGVSKLQSFCLLCKAAIKHTHNQSSSSCSETLTSDALLQWPAIFSLSF